ncbi:Holliday junction resolvase RuvX [Mycoplasmopsis caviae]|uniref:Putative pre-16S rRNA nuclease n=1 Tax=Mycoplasmopsis caviae TaxID=55603 RepID=A0A3P8KD10_9BACT|nr:Holliday junction resolvase RuvX [Mycoplasmopsis caviae]UUD35754.1 Holliday junction resolvase RuvX [Mycoplasmopsis caviae]VDR42404.1 Holliday junction resolvase [Mycoplasmopsis caviae]
MRALALDLGTKSCGFAISDESEIIASALETIYFEECDFDKIIEQIKNYQKTYKIAKLVVGKPLRSNGTSSERTLLFDSFAHKLKETFSECIIYQVNEYGSTKAATSILKEAKLSIKKRKQHKDTISAVLILQEFLNYGGVKLND